MGVLRYLPNLITILRLLLVIPIVVSFHEGEFDVALLLFFLAGISDGLDGVLARRFDWVTPFGKLIDPVADKLLLLATTVSLAILGHFPLMLMFLMIAKDLATIGGVMAYALLAGFPEVRPLFLGKVTTTLQLLLIGGIIIDLIVRYAWLHDALLPALIWVVAVVTLLDGAAYLWIWTNKLAVDGRWLGTERQESDLIQ